MCNVVSFHISNDGETLYAGDCRHHENGVCLHGLKADEAREGEWTVDDNGESLVVRSLPPNHRAKGQELYDGTWYKACILSRWPTRTKFIEHLLTRLPKKVENLYLVGCTGLKALPAGLKVRVDLDLRDCVGLKALPAGLTVGRDLLLCGCVGLKTLPKGLIVGGNLDLSICAGLTELPKGLTVRGDLDLYDCTGLKELPAGLKVGNDLWLTGCTGLKTLPAGLKVGNNLWLTGCAGLTELPEGLRVGGRIKR